MQTRKSALLVVCVLLAGTSWAGTHYTAEMHRKQGISTFEGWMSGSKAKIHITTSTDPGFPVGLDILTRDDGETMDLVSSEKRGYVQISREQLAQHQKQVAAKFGLTVRLTKTEKVSDEDGGVVAGHRTRHYRMQLFIEEHLAQPDGERLAHLVVVEDLWLAQDMKNRSRSLALLTNQTTGMDEIDRVLQFTELRGFTLKRVVAISEDGVPLGSSVVEVKEIQEQAVPESKFDIPPGFQPITPSNWSK